MVYQMLLKPQSVAYFGWIALTSMYVIYRISVLLVGFEGLHQFDGSLAVGSD